MKRHTTTSSLTSTLARLTRATLLGAACAAASLAVGCDQSTDDSQTEVARQLDDADVTLDDALAAIEDEVDEGMVFEADFEMGVDDGYYTIVAVQGDDEVIYEVDARTGEREEAERRAASRERAARARRHADLRRRIARAVREAREEDQRFRPLRLRLRLAAGDDDRRGERAEERLEVEVDLADRDGRVRQVRRAL